MQSDSLTLKLHGLTLNFMQIDSERTDYDPEKP